MTVIYYEDDANLGALHGKTLAVIGYSQQGQAAALNLRDAGLQVTVGGTEATERQAAHDDGFLSGTVEAVTPQADILLLTLPDEIMTPVYMSAISPHLRKGHTLIFDSAYNVAFGFIEPPPFVDVGMVAPRILGQETWQDDPAEGDPYVSFLAVWQDASRQAWETTLAVALGMGALQRGGVEVSIQQEAEINLFIQQAVLPIFHHVMTKAASLLMQKGYPAEAAFIDLYLSGKFSSIMGQVAQYGLMETLKSTSKTGLYGTLSRLDRFDDLKLERLLEVTLDEIRNGDFAREWSQEHADGQPRLQRLLRQQDAMDLWEIEQQTLDMLEDPDLF